MRKEQSKIIQEKIKSIGKSMRKRMTENFKELGLTPSQAMIVGLLQHKGKKKIGELSDELKLSNATISGIVDRLENQNVVIRERSSSDRRAVYVDLDKDFKKKLKEKHDSINDNMLELFKDATEDELNTIVEGLTLLESILSKGE